MVALPSVRCCDHRSQSRFLASTRESNSRPCDRYHPDIVSSLVPLDEHMCYLDHLSQDVAIPKSNHEKPEQYPREDYKD
ncbi:hypothetical protein PHLCEN_2v12921 [Hermanssonia centrifuga]|uniref:Uncharacterized protein n=1 Tax=Hermanssonia centrifuga TaxID=98765 RepID=A0A2R6NFW9_9APHY|nr:hypothetical protein PHLCEN_2v12921 [Hermanssonia centrifuga]